MQDCNYLRKVCGVYTMVINGQGRQGCSTLIKELLREVDSAIRTPDKTAKNLIALEPLSKFPVVRGLMANRHRVFDALITVKGQVPIDSTQHVGPGPAESPSQQDTRYALSRCITPGCCLETYPQFQLDNDSIKAYTIGQIWQQTTLHAMDGILNETSTITNKIDMGRTAEPPLCLLIAMTAMAQNPNSQPSPQSP